MLIVVCITLWNGGHKMPKEDYERGVKDGKHGSRAGSPEKHPIRAIMTGGTSQKELQQIRDYEQGRKHGQMTKKK